MMKFHVFYTRNLSAQIIDDHRRVASHVGVDVEYHEFEHDPDYNRRYTMHGRFMTSVIRDDPDEVSCFLDADCLPYDAGFLRLVFDWVTENRSFAGNAQNISHAVTRNRVYAGASMLMVHKDAWRRLGSPSLAWTKRLHSLREPRVQIDTSELLTMRANRAGFGYRLLLPLGFDSEPAWDLGPFGSYGHGTLYPGTWHHFQANQLANGPTELWADRVESILADRGLRPKHASRHFDAT